MLLETAVKVFMIKTEMTKALIKWPYHRFYGKVKWKVNSKRTKDLKLFFMSSGPKLPLEKVSA